MPRIEEWAERLLQAEETGVPTEPLTAAWPEIDIPTAYQVQLKVIEHKCARGQRVVGMKIGLTSRAMQQMLGVYEPDYGHILDSMVLLEGEPVRLSRLIQPKVEAEIAFVLRERLTGPGVTVADVLRATAGVLPALEIIDSRIRDWKIKIQDTIADNASSAAIILGGKFMSVEGLDLRLLGLVLEKDGEVFATGAGASVLGHPAAAVAWLANAVACYGLSLEPGMVVLSGSFTQAVAVSPGSVIRASFDHLGSVTAKFIDA
ncbi:2-keto-4-pentenoate hydratase [Desulfurispora thermophila]|uniref:2-keto-4-pentenoate hydratase n=1 Tax=Desulfurispora thermophila TaxID=265470 RepID=UPI00036D30CA|nr:fumarylacetoacetate hydrolase family protein [Desulfurispora thermophila]